MTGRKLSGIIRIKPNIHLEIYELLKKNNNKCYCDSITTFVSIAVRELLDDIKNNENKIRWKK